MKKVQIYGEVLDRGPGKVLKNLILGLEELKIEYSFNEEPIKDSYKISLTPTPIMDSNYINEMLIGPNVCVLPFENQKSMEQKYKKMVVPSYWVRDLYNKWIDNDKLVVWPVGVDTTLFSDKSQENKTIDCLIYVKRRSPIQVEQIQNFLTSKIQSFRVIEYGFYTEEEFIDILSKSKYCVVIDSTESQGIAIQEIMSCNLPILVWDVTEWVDYGEQFRSPATSVPYWDNTCGEKFYNISEINETFTKFKENLHLYQPRKFVTDNLSLSKQVMELIKIFKEK